MTPAINWDALTGRTLHEERLRTLIACPSLFDRDPVKNYNRKHICVMCDAVSDSRENLTHTKVNCDVEFRQVMMFAWHLQRQKINCDHKHNVASFFIHSCEGCGTVIHTTGNPKAVEAYISAQRGDLVS